MSKELKTRDNSDVLTPDNISSFIQNHTDKIKKSLSKSVNIDKYVSQFLGEVRKNPKLIKCSKSSIIISLISCAQLDLYVGSSLGQSYLIPYEKGRGSGEFECQVQIGYKGLIELGMRTGKIRGINAQVIYENDKLDYQLGTSPFINHIPAMSNRGKMIGVYAVAHLDSGFYQFDIMSKQQIEEIRTKYANKYSTPWQTSYDEMSKKTVIKKLFKYLPLSPEINRAVTLDDYAESGIQKQVIDIDNVDEIESIDSDVVESSESKNVSTDEAIERELINVNK